MPFDPTKPVSGTPANSLEMRNQLNALKALIDALQAQVNGLLPVGMIVGWDKSRANMPALPGTWAECNGQVLNDPASPFDGQALPDLNVTQRFLRGASASGGVGGSDSHAHTIDWTGANVVGINGDAYGTDYPFAQPNTPFDTAPASSLPAYYEVVWVMRVR